jgi:hypothetical protein
VIPEAHTSDMFSQIGAPELLILLVLALAFGFVPWLVGLVDALRTPDGQWEAAGQSKILYVLLMVFLGLLGTVLYALIARAALKRIVFTGAVNGVPDTGA